MASAAAVECCRTSAPACGRALIAVNPRYYTVIYAAKNVLRIISHAGKQEILPMHAVESNLARLGITLPAAPAPVASYVPFVQAGSLVFISGQLPTRDGKLQFKGRVAASDAIEPARGAARLAAINAIAVLRNACQGDWSRLVRIVKLTVFVACEADFDRQPVVANGASDLVVEVFGEAGRHARAAVGTNALPLGSTVELEMIAQLAAS